VRVVIGADHAGFELKQALGRELEALGHEVIDVGAHDEQPSDYPDFAEKVALEIVNQRADRGVLVCGSGIGASVAANKIPGIRAGNCMDTYSAHQGVEHDDVNVLVMGSRIVGIELARELMHAFLNAKFSGEERHVRRLNKVTEIEARYCGAEAKR
jgi:RpiB/LacA/LacB family sugar-phosphate isomerase